MSIFENNLQKNTLKKFAVAGLSAAVAIASGCSSDNPDVGSALSTNSLSGAAVDGYLAGATVYLDITGNGKKDAGEPSAITDKDGYFTTSKDGLTDYCASDATQAEAIHCLSAVETGEDVVLRSQGGFDIFTGEPFDGALSVKLEAADFETDGTLANQIISPLTSMLTEATPAEKTNILSAYGLADGDEDRDFLTAAEFDANTTNAAITFHKVVTIFSDVFDDKYDVFGKEIGYPDNTNDLVYKALADQLASGSELDSSSLTDAFDSAQTAIHALYDADEDESYDGDVDGSQRTAAISNATKILGLVDNAIPLSTTVDEAQARVTGVEVVVQKMVEGANSTQVDAAIAEAGDTASDLYTELDSATAIDFSALVDVDYTAPSPDYSEVDITGASTLMSLTNQQLYVSYDEDENLNDNKSGSAYFFFSADESGTSGTLNTCLSYDDGEVGTSTEESDGTLFEGTWFALDDFRLIVTVEGSVDFTLMSKGMTSGGKHKYSLSYSGETVSWLSDDGLVDGLEDVDSVTEPTTDAGCVALLTPDQV